MGCGQLFLAVRKEKPDVTPHEKAIENEKKMHEYSYSYSFSYSFSYSVSNSSSSTISHFLPILLLLLVRRLFPMV